jgi:hypothetical protein
MTELPAEMQFWRMVVSGLVSFLAVWIDVLVTYSKYCTLSIVLYKYLLISYSELFVLALQGRVLSISTPTVSSHDK